MPTFVLLKEGKEMGRVVGGDQSKIVQLIETAEKERKKTAGKGYSLTGPSGAVLSGTTGQVGGVCIVGVWKK